MSEATVLFGLGATKAGTSWLYQALHDHPGCRLRAVKEFHYWDTFAPDQCRWQVAAFQKRLRSLRSSMDVARAASNRRRENNLQRQADDLQSLINVLAGDRTEHTAYRTFLANNAATHLVADITPSYGLLPNEMVRQMLAAFPRARFIYLMRDPVARLWSHVRMEAERSSPPSENIEERANLLLKEVLHNDHSQHILARGDYPTTAERLKRLVPAKQLRLCYSERLFGDNAWAEMEDWLGIEAHRVNVTVPVHAGRPSKMWPHLATTAFRLLEEHYFWAEVTIGKLPSEWQRVVERESASTDLCSHPSLTDDHGQIL